MADSGPHNDSQSHDLDNDDQTLWTFDQNCPMCHGEGWTSSYWRPVLAVAFAGFCFWFGYQYFDFSKFQNMRGRSGRNLMMMILMAYPIGLVCLIKAWGWRWARCTCKKKFPLTNGPFPASEKTLSEMRKIDQL